MGDFINRQEGFSLGICSESQPDPSMGHFWEQRLLVGAAPLVVVLLPRGKDTAGEGPANLPCSPEVQSKVWLCHRYLLLCSGGHGAQRCWV